MAEPISLSLVVDSHSEQVAIYIDGVLRGEYESNPSPEELFDCYSAYAHEKPVVIELYDIDLEGTELFDDANGIVDWPDQIAGLNIPF